MTNGPEFQMNIRSEDDARLAGILLAQEVALAYILRSIPEGADILDRLLSVGDRIETGQFAASHKLIAIMGASARQCAERLAGASAISE